MKKYCGPLLEVSPVEHLDKGQGWTIDTIRIGDQTLRKVKVDLSNSNLLSPDRKRDVCLYIFRILFTSNLLGMKYLDTGEKHLVPLSFVLGSCLRYAVVCTIVYSIAGALLAGFLGNVAAL